MRPPTLAACLRQPGSCLPCPDVEPSRPLQLRQPFSGCAGAKKLFAGERRQPNGLDELRSLIAKRLEEIHELRVEVVAGLDRIRFDIQQHGRRAAEDIAEVRCVMRYQRQQEIEMREFSAIPTEGDQPLRAFPCDPASCPRSVDTWGKGGRRRHQLRAPDGKPLFATKSR